MFKRSQPGFTLIEITIVMAISSGLAVIALMGFSTIRAQAQFGESVERLKENVLVKRQEALATVKFSGGGTSCVTKNDLCDVTFGRILTFTPGSSTAQVQTLITRNNQAPVAGQAVAVLAAEDTSLALPWGVTYQGWSTGSCTGASFRAQTAQVGFTRSLSDGALQTAISRPGAGWPAALTYGNFLPTATTVNLCLRDPDSRWAYITVNPANSGVTRTFQ